MLKKLFAKISLKELLAIHAGTFIVAVAVYFFMQPSQISIGSGAALAMILANFIPLPMSTILLALNIVLLIIGFLLVGPEFGAKTVYCAILMPLIIAVFEIVFPDFQSITADPALDMVCYILVVGVGLSFLFSCNASSGGLDIVAKIMNKYLRMDLGAAMSLSGMVVAAGSALNPGADPKIVVLSLLGTYFGGLVVDHFIFGLNIKRRVCILSPRVDDIVHYILYDLHSGASLSNTIGAYDNVVRKEIITIVDKQEYRLLMDYVRRVDPKAFVTVYSVSEVSYTPKKRA
ncbi:MAG: YitT family protein [Clostridia bacterium]|nr:YitT family protein [Clostridia bacterium]